MTEQKRPAPDPIAIPASSAPPGEQTTLTRTETDSIGSLEIPASAYWGVHTARANENFP
ncbi:hypothetical protein DFO66_1051, partial [Brevibacterium sanguinis]